MLEHLADTDLYLEGEQHGVHWILRATKNRFGFTKEIGVFEMSHLGMVEVAIASQFFLLDRETERKGSAIVCGLESSRLVLIDIQRVSN